MRRAWQLLVPAWLAACEGRQVSVFEVTDTAGDSSQGGGGGGAGTAPGGAGGQTAGGGGTSAGMASAGSAMVAPGSGGSRNEFGGFPGFGGELGGQLGGQFSSGGGPTSPPSCSSNSDCPGQVCDKRSCDATATGVCVPWPPLCDPTPKPVCGCDGVTYWNDCLRLQTANPTGLAGPDPCRATASSCDVGADCNVPYASCSHLLPPGAQCGHGLGTCWVLPLRCDPSADSKRWRECKPPPDGLTSQCLDTCAAIATEHSYADLHRGETCN